MKQMRRRARPALMEANAALLFAAMGLGIWTAARLFLGREWSSLEAQVIWDGLAAALLIALAARLTGRIKPEQRESRLRLGTPTIAQGVLTLLCVCAGTLFYDDITLLTGAFLQRIGLDVSRTIAATGPAPGWLYLARVILCGVLPAVGTEWFFHGAQMAAWEKRGTMYAVWITSFLCAGLCGSVVRLPAEIALSVAAGCIAVKTGSLFLAGFLRAGVGVAGIAARHVQSRIGMEKARFGRLWAELGGKQGWLLLALETLLLGLVFFFTARATCCAKPRVGAPWRERQVDPIPMDAAEVFVLCTAIATALGLLLTDFLQMAGIF